MSREPRLIYLYSPAEHKFRDMMTWYFLIADFGLLFVFADQFWHFLH